ncbi:MAG: hypothetical protein IJ638_04005 [Alphaproteobacteria bacterium]|nr:hypothetical protein [Alphaproteobacteria bacterium]
MKKFLLIIMLLVIEGCSKQTPSIRLNVIPAKKDGPVLTQIDVWANNDCYNQTYFVDPKTGDIVFEQLEPYNCKDENSAGVGTSFIFFKDKKACSIAEFGIEESPFSNDYWLNYYNNKKCDIKIK